MAGTSRKRQESSESPRSRAKNSRGRETLSGRGTASAQTDKKSRKETAVSRKKGAGRADTKAKNSRRKGAQQEPEEKSFIGTEVAIIAVFAVSVLLFLSNFHLCGVAGDYLRQAMLGMFGKLGYVFPVLLCVGSCFYASNRGNKRAVIKLAASVLTLIALCGLAQLIFGGGYREELKILDYFRQDAVSGKGGGLTGGVLVLLLGSTVGTIGAYLILLVLFAIGVVCITERSLVGAVKKGSGRAYRYAKDDMDRRREIYEEKREERQKERRRMREEKARGIDMDAATLYGYPEDGDYRDEPFKDDYILEPEREEPLDSADIFRGSITMPGRRQEEDLTYSAAETAGFSERESENRMPEEKEKMQERRWPEQERATERPEESEQAARIWETENREDGDYIQREKGQEQENEPGHSEPEVYEKDEHFNRRPLVSRRKDSPHAMELARKQEAKEAESGADDDTVPYSGVRYQDTPAREETLLKSIYADRDMRTFAEMSIEDGFFHPGQEDDEFETVDPWPESEQGKEEGEVSGGRELDSEDLAGRDALFAVRAHLEREGAKKASASEERGYYKEMQPGTDKNGRDSFFIPDEAKTVVTASGKVIETDTEEIRKTIEKKRADYSRIPDSDLSVREQMDRRKSREASQPSQQKTEKKPYVFPPLDLLKKGKPIGGRSEQVYKDTAVKLQQTLKNFGVGVTVTNISCGPAVTRYELHPEQGVKVSKIVSLSDDIKLNLAAADIRIEAPIPGKAAVGIEVPNKETETVLLRDLLESEEFKRASSKLSFAVGKDIAGQTVVTDIAKMPHLLIAGATGSGKSVCINTLIMSVIYKADPEDVKLIMIDPKVVELSVYNGIPHLLIPVVTDPKKASGALNWAVAEMTERYQKFAKYNVRDLKGYNEKIKSIEDIEDENKPKKLPQIIIIVDELADLMMVAPGEVEDAICRLAQLARAAGIHLVIATQRPSVNVITGLIKANIPSRIAFSVSSGVDSRTIIDMNGAEKLLGKGDMLFYPQGIQKPQRVQGAFVSDQEVSRVVEFLAEQGLTTEYDPEVEKKMNAPCTGAGPDGGNDRDAYFEQAARFIIEKDKASIGMLQRMLKIGFNRAARIMDQLAEAGVVGEDEGTKPRKVLMSLEQFEELLEQGY